MGLFSSPLRPAAAAVALAMALSGCAVQRTAEDTVPSAMILSGGGAVSSDQGAAQPDEPDPSSKDDTPSFQELPSSEEPSQSGEGSVPPPSSSQASSSQVSSSQAPPVSSSQPEEESSAAPEGEQDPDEQDEEDGDDDWEDDDRDDEDDGGGDEDDDDPGSYGESSDWEDLKVKSGGSTVSGDAVSIVSRMVQNEVGSSFPDEAVKAQAVAAYTFVRYHNSIAGDVPSVGLSSAGGVSSRVEKLVRQVAGEQITYNGKPILATYCAMSAGVTASAQSVWGSSLPYLVPVDSEGDEAASGYRYTVTKTADDVKAKLTSYLGVSLSGTDPESWFDIRSYWDGGPYVNKVSIAGKKETTGRVIRESILGLRSAAFTVAYDERSDKFTFTTYGYGHGVGMSQMGAKYYADKGWDHVEILEHYYSGATVG